MVRLERIRKKVINGPLMSKERVMAGSSGEKSLQEENVLFFRKFWEQDVIIWIYEIFVSFVIDSKMKHICFLSLMHV